MGYLRAWFETNPFPRTLFFIAEQAAEDFTTHHFLLSYIWVLLLLLFGVCLGFSLLINKANSVLLLHPEGILLLQLFS